MLHQTHVALAVMTFASTALLAATALAVPFAVVRLPSDFFITAQPQRSRFRRTVRLFAGALLLVLGIAMLVLPGQGILTIFAGLWLLEFPAKDRLMSRTLRIPRVRLAMNAIRKKAGRDAFFWPP